MTWPASPNSHSVVSGTVRYADGALAGPLPEEVTLVDRFQRDEQASEHRIHFRARRRSAEAPSADTFTLAAYDLGDYPWDVEPQPEDRGSRQLMVHTPVLYFDRPAPKTFVDLSFQLTNSGSQAVRVVGMEVWLRGHPSRRGLAVPNPTRPDQEAHAEAPGIPRRRRRDETRFPLYLYTTAPGQAEVELTLVGRSSTGDR